VGQGFSCCPELDFVSGSVADGRCDQGSVRGEGGGGDSAVAGAQGGDLVARRHMPYGQRVVCVVGGDQRLPVWAEDQRLHWASGWST
jgi:hypothetical protein